MAITPGYRSQHVRGELRRGHIERCPKSWIREAKRLSSDPDFRRACDLALQNWPQPDGPTMNEIYRLTGSVYYRRPKTT